MKLSKIINKVVFLALITFKAAAGQPCDDIQEYSELGEAVKLSDLAACMRYQDSAGFSYFDVNIVSEVATAGLKISGEDGLAETILLEPGITQFGINYGFETTQFKFNASEETKPFTVSAVVDYEKVYPTISFVILEDLSHKQLKQQVDETNTKLLGKKLFSLNGINKSRDRQLNAASSCSAGNTSPVAPPVLDANLNGNARFMEFLKGELSFVGRLLYFKSKVGNKQVWDFKQLGSQYQDYGNYHYGTVGVALGIPEQVLLRAAGWAQMQAGTTQETWGHYLGSAPFGDDPNDQAWIKKGIDYYKNVYSKKSDSEKSRNSDFCNDENNANVPTSAGSGGGAGGGGGTPPGTGLPPIIITPPPSGGHGGSDCGTCHRGTITDL